MTVSSLNARDIFPPKVKQKTAWLYSLMLRDGAQRSIDVGDFAAFHQ
jgi:hypothetical protein